MTDDRPDGTHTVTIPEETADEIAQRLHATEFDSVDAYVTFTMELVLRELEREEETGDAKSPSGTGEENEAVRERLETLGYL